MQPGAETKHAAGRSDAAGPRRHDLGVLRRILGFARPYAPALTAVALFTLVFSAGRYARAYLVKPLLDGVLLPAADDPQAALRQILLIAGVIVVVTPLALYGRSVLSEYVLGRVHLDLQRRLAGKLLALPLSAHERTGSGDWLTRVQSDARGARETLKLVFQELLLALTMIGVGLGTLLAISPALTLASLLAAPGIVAVVALFGRRIRHTAMDRQEQLGEVTGRLVGILSGIKVIKAFAAEEAESEAFGREAGRLFRHDMRVVRHRALSLSAVEALNSAAGIAILALGAVLVMQGRFGLTAGDVAFFATALATTYRPVKNVARGWGRLMEHLASGERFLAVLDAPEERPDAPGAVALRGVGSGVVFDDVSLCWTDERGRRREALRGVTLHARPGEVLAVVGPTGSGKTSLMDLLLRFREPTGGAVRIDGHDLRDVTRRSLHAHVAVVTQDPFLFDASIADNIRYGRPEASEEDVLAAARAAHVDEFALQLPDGYATPVGEFGVRLSGGQRQRITIARALLSRPGILVFDEATSALDAKTEHIVQQAIDAMRGGRVILLVAHRLSTVRRADRIAVLVEGRVVEQGSHAELMDAGGSYAELFALQAETRPPTDDSLFPS